MKRAQAGLLLLILLLAAALRFYGLGAQSLWNDEGTSVAVAQRDVATIAQDAAGDIHPPLYYWLLSGWVRLLGTGEAAVRSLSALLGVALVALTYALGRRLLPGHAALAAAFLSAINPFQIYYSQETRMYMLLAALSAAAVLAMIGFVRRGSWPALLALALLEVAGLYTHYSFLFMVLVLNLAFALSLWRPLPGPDGHPLRPVLLWAGFQVAVVLAYLPWLPVALRQVGAWPSPARPALLPALVVTWRWLVFGPTASAWPVAAPLLAAALAASAGAWFLGMRQADNRGLPTRWPTLLALLWLGLPVGLMFILGLYREAYLKFLLVTAPAVSLLLAAGLTIVPRRASPTPSRLLRLAQLAAALLILVGTFLSLRAYYADPAFARDDYRAIAAYVQAAGRPGDAVLLNAPGQAEVFGYYYHGDLPVYSLPESRPLDEAATDEALAELARPGSRVFAVLWATGESDPDRFVEGWLDRRTYKALDAWYGNVRLAVYAVPDQAPASAAYDLNVPLSDAQSGDRITLLGHSLGSERLSAGDIAPISLFWRADETPAQRYKVFLHLLDQAGHIVGQRDAEPGGGVGLTTLWAPGQTIADNYGLPIHPATPPGTYRLEVGMYEPQTGRRLLTPDGATQVWLEPLVVERPAAPAPVAALGMHHPVGTRFGELALLGYDTYRLGFDLQPDLPLHPGDVLDANLYWQAEEPPSGRWAVEMSLIAADGQPWVSYTTDVVDGFPTDRWQAGDVWRGQFDLAVPFEAPPDQYRLRVQPIAPDGTRWPPFLSDRLRLEPLEGTP